VVTVGNVENGVLSSTTASRHLASPRILCDGNNITVPGLASGEEGQRLSSDSTATAITVGVASLILASWRILQSGHSNYSAEGFRNRELCRILELSMYGRTNLQPWKFGEQPVRTKGRYRPS
jgi:hypothetical protein